MRRILWEDAKGYKHASLIRENDPDSMAPKGMPVDPPDLSTLDWNGVAKDLHNLFVERGLFTWADVQRQQNGVANALVSVLRPRIIAHYRTSPNGGDYPTEE